MITPFNRQPITWEKRMQKVQLAYFFKTLVPEVKKKSAYFKTSKLDKKSCLNLKTQPGEHIDTPLIMKSSECM